MVWIAVLGDPAFPLDDAYITLHNAQSLLSGVDRQFGASPLLGATSSVHLLLVTALGLIVSLPWAAAIVAWGGAGLYLLGLSYLASALKHPRRHETVREFHGKRMRIDTRPKMRVSIDGELGPETPFEAWAVPEAITVAAPRPSRSG